jgi:hypothetical protein
MRFEPVLLPRMERKDKDDLGPWGFLENASVTVPAVP